MTRHHAIASLTLAGALGIALIATPTIAEETVGEVDQGGVAVWGEGCERCSFDGRAWDAVDGKCYFPVDFARRPDHYRVARWCGGVREEGWLIVRGKPCIQEDIDFPDDAYVHLSAEDLERHWREQAQVKPILRAAESEARFQLPTAPPARSLPSGESNFAACRTFNGEPRARHRGRDYAVAGPALAVADGEVVLTGEHFFAGKSVYVDHGNGLITTTFHLGEIGVSVGDEVSRGATLGQIGSTGRSTGIHIHVGANWHGEWIDPTVLLDAPGSLSPMGAE